MPSIKTFAVTAAIVLVVMFAAARFAPASVKKQIGMPTA
jgi:hypothetical protein